MKDEKEFTRLGLMDVFKLLTPKVINNITQATSLRNKNAPILGLGFVEEEDEQGIVQEADKARILPFNREAEAVVESNELKVAVGQSFTPESKVDSRLREIESKIDETSLAESSSALESIGVVKSERARKMEELRAEKERLANPTSTQFLLAEREKVKSINKKVSSVLGLDNYKKSSMGKVKTSDVGDGGVLVDKKQF